MNHASHLPRTAVFFAILLSVAVLPQAEAVVVSNTTENTTAPADDFGFANIGTCNGSSCVYLGYGWVLTAQHVIKNGQEPTTVSLNGQTYTYEAGTSVILNNPTGQGLTTETDLELFRLTEAPRLPSVKLVSQYMNVWDEVVMVGNGRNREETLTAWNVEGTYPGSEAWIWTETTDPLEADKYGFGTLSTKTIRWGTNQVEQYQYKANLNGRDIIAFRTDFDQYGGTEFEAQAVIYDSGGSVFHKNGGQWELVGIINAVDGYPDQPDVIYNPIYGDYTYCADLMEYRDQILDIITPLPGDANLDGRVDAADVSIMAANWGQTEDIFWMDGDFNEDGTVNEQDAKILAGNWGATSAESEQSSMPVPEPSMLALLLAGCFIQYGIRYRTFSRRR